MTVSIEKTGSLAIVTIDNPPVNAASHAVRSGIVEAVKATEADAVVKAVVLRAAGRTFTAGADIREFGKPPQDPSLPDVVNALEGTTKPWVAALHGTVLGGGLEIALGCHYRIAAQETKFGFPEVNLGLIPGAGGTVRLPRLVTAEEALNMIVSGKPISSGKAKTIGLIDEFADADLAEAAQSYAHSVIGVPLPTPLGQCAPNAPADLQKWQSTKDKLAAKARGTKAPVAAIAAVQDALDLPAGDALQSERDTFTALKSDPQSAAMRYIFFAERSVGKLPQLKGVKVDPPKTVGVIGGGTMGAGIAVNCLLSGLDVTMIERDTAACEAGRDRITQTLDQSLKRGLITAETHAGHLRRLATSTDYATLSDVDLVIEAVFEDMEIKHQVFAALDKVVRPDTVLATNTSYLDINTIAAKTANPSRVIGLHFFSPAHIMKLLEVIIPEQADPSVIAKGFALGRKLGKIAVPSGVCDGFIGNRIMSAYRRECEYMVEDGAMPWDVDKAMREFGWPMGIFEMQDLAGLDIAWAMRKRKAATRDPHERYVDLGDRLCEAGRLGRKTGHGWYDHNDGKVVPSTWVEQLILEQAAAKGITRQPMSATAICDRIINVMQTEAQALIAEGITFAPSDVDVVMVNGYGFPRWRGGPVFMQEQEASHD